MGCMAQSHVLQIKRIYDSAQPTDGYRVLVDRVWPRGVSKERADLDRWAKTEVTPTTDLRKWFAHDPAKFDEFKARYIEQLDEGASRISHSCRPSSDRASSLQGFIDLL